MTEKLLQFKLWLLSCLEPHPEFGDAEFGGVVGSSGRAPQE